MEFNFSFEGEDDDEEYLDLSDNEPRPIETVELEGVSFAFTDEVPDKKTLADPNVKRKAQESRSKRPGNYQDKKADGWSYACAHQKHLPNVCEKEQDRGTLECSCPCHEERGYEPPLLQGGSEQEEFLILD